MYIEADCRIDFEQVKQALDRKLSFRMYYKLFKHYARSIII